MNTKQLVSSLADRQNMSKAETRRILDAFVESMSDSLENSRSFDLPGIGTFQVQGSNENDVQNTGKQNDADPPDRVVQFNPTEN